MAITISAVTTDVIDVEDYVDYIKANVNTRDIDEICASAPYLVALSNNRRFLVDLFNSDLMRYSNGDLLHTYNPQSTIIWSDDEFIVRANIWMPLSPDEKRKKLEEKLYSYASAHDHNFDLLTVGYHGRGYRTEIYEYDRSGIEGYPGEPVELTFLEDTTLPRGKVMAFRASKDVHTQIPPEEISISLNLLSRNREMTKRQQFFFDVQKGCIDRFAEDSNSRRVDLITVANWIGNENTVDILESIAKTHECSRTRAAAYYALLERLGNSTDWVHSAIENDPDPLLRSRLITHGRSL
jgi:hypothetical protein